MSDKENELKIKFPLHREQQSFFLTKIKFLLLY
jgi:hypothetical protein